MGTLYLVATPIGNLEDITLRGLRILKEVSLIAAEDTRRTQRLLTHYEIETSTISYYEHNKLGRLDQILSALDHGDVALVSDAGTPGLSDPGYELVNAVWQAGHTVSPIPGPSAPLSALVASGLATDSFLYLGYPPRKASEKRKLFQSLAGETRTLLFLEAPHRVLRTLELLAEELGAQRQAAVARELTKMHEEILRSSLGDLYKHFLETEPRGEFTLVVSGAEDEQVWAEEQVRVELQAQLSAGVKPSEAARSVASQAGWPRQRVYKLTLEDG